MTVRYVVLRMRKAGYIEEDIEEQRENGVFDKLDGNDRTGPSFVEYSKMLVDYVEGVKANDRKGFLLGGKGVSGLRRMVCRGLSIQV